MSTHTHRLRSILIGSLVAALAVAVAGRSAPAGESGPGVSELIQDRAMVRLRPGTPLGTFLDAFAADPANEGISLVPLDVIEGRAIHFLEVQAEPGADVEGLDDRIEEDYLAALQWGELLYAMDAPEGSSGSTGSTYVDGIASSAFGSQYLGGRIGLEGALERSVGAGVAVAVLDTGVDATHEVLDGSVLGGGWDFVTGTADTSDRGNGEDDDGDGEVDELVGHGTFVAGIVRLVAPEARILPVRVINGDGRGDLWRLTQGLFFAIDRGVEVINVSIRSTYDSEGVLDAILEARSRGIVVVGAAGNFDIDRREFPATEDFALGVCALDDQDVKADFSSFERRNFISAPGAAVIDGEAVDLDRSIIGPLPGDRYAAWEGTSLAAPIVAGTAALVRSQHPLWPSSATTVDQIRGVLATSAEDIYDENPQYAEDERLGVGRVDAAAATALGPVAPGPGDLDGDGMVGATDLLRLLEDWGLVHSTADLDASGEVGTADLLILLSRWGG